MKSLLLSLLLCTLSFSIFGAEYHPGSNNQKVKIQIFWTYPYTNVNPIAFKVYSRPLSHEGGYTEVYNAGTNFFFNLTNLPAFDPLAFIVTAVDPAFGLESEPSDEAIYNPSRPLKPQGGTPDTTVPGIIVEKVEETTIITSSTSTNTSTIKTTFKVLSE